MKTDKFADPSQEMKWAVFIVVLSQSTCKIVVEVLQGKNFIFDIFSATSSLNSLIKTAGFPLHIMKRAVLSHKREELNFLSLLHCFDF